MVEHEARIATGNNQLRVVQEMSDNYSCIASPVVVVVNNFELKSGSIHLVQQN